MSNPPDGSLLLVLPTGKSPRDAPATLRDIYDLTCREQMEPKWITTQDCLAKSSRNPTEVFVCDPFEGPAFDHLTALNCRVVGPLCMALCIQEQQSLPRRPNPLYSLSFRGMVVTVSALSPPERQKVQTRVELMGGTYMAALTKSVTHVVAVQCIVEKLRPAGRNLPFALSTDASNKGNRKLFPIAVRFYHVNGAGITDTLICFCEQADETSRRHLRTLGNKFGQGGSSFRASCSV
ncbi:hypothetical protein HPB47_023296 [Ixodes persulcatus]|uniref:Uncharacterized protein n=1 Tax=Ixodes persulcatus TaxID=34615 RepID=A0AC60Q7B2_IXOPE|nr:hypothetical protein HPB47_023296 [Ixodes persulcatus]